MMKTPADLPQNAEQYNGAALAYIGDAVFEIYVRCHLLERGYTQPQRMHRLAKQYVSAPAQAKVLQYWLAAELLDEEEITIVKRGRNAKIKTSHKQLNYAVYRMSTAFESLIGFLYLKGRMGRLEQLINQAYTIVEGNESTL